MIAFIRKLNYRRTLTNIEIIEAANLISKSYLIPKFIINAEKSKLDMDGHTSDLRFKTGIGRCLAYYN